MITISMKDKVLFYMVSSFPLEELCYYGTEAIRIETDTSYVTLYAILHQFQRLQFLSELVIGPEYTSFVLHNKMYLFAQNGGFKTNEKPG